MPTLELTDKQILHVQSLLNQDKPSRTRLTSEEKKYLAYIVDLWYNELEEAGGTTKEIKLTESIIKKLN